MKKIQENERLQYKTEMFLETQIENGVNGRNPESTQQEKQELSQEGDNELKEILDNLNEPINLIDSNTFQMDSRYFKLEMQKECKLLTFENKHV